MSHFTYIREWQNFEHRWPWLGVKRGSTIAESAALYGSPHQKMLSICEHGWPKLVETPTCGSTASKVSPSTTASNRSVRLLFVVWVVWSDHPGCLGQFHSPTMAESVISGLVCSDVLSNENVPPPYLSEANHEKIRSAVEEEHWWIGHFNLV